MSFPGILNRPHWSFLMYRNVIFSVGIVFIALIGFVQLAIAQHADRVANSDEVRILSLINRERSRKGLYDLDWNDNKAVLARSYSKRMAREHFYTHVDSSRSNVVDRARKMRIQSW